MHFKMHIKKFLNVYYVMQAKYTAQIELLCGKFGTNQKLIYCLVFDLPKIFDKNR